MSCGNLGAKLIMVLHIDARDYNQPYGHVRHNLSRLGASGFIYKEVFARVFFSFAVSCVGWGLGGKRAALKKRCGMSRVSPLE